MLLYRALNRLDEAGWQAHKLTKYVESGFLLDRESWDTMDTYGMGPQKKIFPPRDVSYLGPIFPEQTILQYPDLSGFGLTEEQHSQILSRLKAASVANRVEVERCQAWWAARFSTLHGTLE